MAEVQWASPALVAAPSGTFTFLISDVEDSTRAWDRHPAGMQAAMRLHDAVFTRCVDAYEGRQIELGREGDSVMCVFDRASQAVECAVAIQTELGHTQWPPDVELRVRLGVHTGEAEQRQGHYFGPALYRCARLMAIASGGQTLVSGPTRDLVVDTLPDSVKLVDLGTHRLRGLSRPEHVFQLAAPELRFEFPPLASVDGTRTNLPSELTSFLGRAAETSELSRLIASHRMVTVTGVGGMGKTRIALHVASRLLDSYPDGVWLVELAAISDPQLVVAEVANRLGVRETSGLPLLQAITDELRPRNCMIVLDNCEHLIGPCVELAGRVLTSCPHVVILATSRESLATTGEQVMRLASLSVAGGGTARTPSNSAQLFIERAWPDRSATDLDRRQLDLIEEICRRLDGIPLAIELAAARARMLTLDELLARLGDRLSLLTGGPRALPRHQTLRATFDWSYELLDASETALYRRLAVFAGGFTILAVESVCAGDGVERGQILDLLAQLVDKSLVMPVQIGDQEGPMRVLATLREYAYERLAEAGEAEHFTRRHAEHFLQLAERARDMQNRAARSDWMDQLEREHENLRAALASSHSADLNLRLAVALIGFWDERGYLTEGREWLAKAVAAWPEETALRAEALGASGWLAQRQGDFERAKQYFAESMRIADAAGDRGVQARSLRNLALVKLLEGDSAGASPLVADALALSEGAGDKPGTAGAHLVMALTAYFTGDSEPARRHGEESLELHRALGDEKVAAFILACLATLALDQADVAKARGNLIESLEISRRLHERVDVAFVLESCARLLLVSEQPARAITLAGAAASIRKASGATAAPPWAMLLEALLGPARDELGAQAAAAAWSDGLNVTLDEAVRLALEWLAT